MCVVLHAVLCCFQVRAPCLLPVCPAVHVALEPREPVLPLENEEALVVWSSLLAHLVLHREEVELLLMLCVFPEHVVVCGVVDGETPPLCRCCCCHCVVHSWKERVFRFRKRKEHHALNAGFAALFSLHAPNFGMEDATTQLSIPSFKPSPVCFSF